MNRNMDAELLRLFKDIMTFLEQSPHAQVICTQGKHGMDVRFVNASATDSATLTLHTDKRPVLESMPCTP